MKNPFKQANKSGSQAVRQDGYTAYRASIVMMFQAVIEHEIATLPTNEQTTAYEGLRLALLKARSADLHMIGYETDDLMHLRSIYNNVVDAGNGLAYVAR